MVGNCSCNSIVVLLCLSGSWSHLVQAARFATPALSSNIFLFQEYRSIRRESQRASDGMSLQLASLLRGRYQQSMSKVLLIGQHMCYHRGRESQRLDGVAWHCTLSNPRQALTRLVGAPDTYHSILVVPGEVSVQQMTYHFISLHTGVLRWVRRKGDLR